MSDRIAVQARILGDLIAEAAAQALASVEAAKEEAEERIRLLAPPVEFNLLAAADYLGISERTLHRRIAERAIAYRRDGNRILFTRAALDEYRQKGTVRALQGRPLPGF